MKSLITIILIFSFVSLSVSADEDKSKEDNHDHLKITKFIFFGVFLVVCFLIGSIPICIPLKKLKKFVSYTNTFSASIGMSLCLFMLLPISINLQKEFFTENGGEAKYGKLLTHISWPLVCTFFSYSLSLLAQKVIFGTKSNEADVVVIAKDKDNNTNIEEKEVINLDENEEVFKSLAGARGRFSTYIGMKSLQNKDNSIKLKASALRASLVINKSMRGSIYSQQNELMLFVNPNKVDISNDNKSVSSNDGNKGINEVEKEKEKKIVIEEDNKSLNSLSKFIPEGKAFSPIFGYLLLIAISWHGLFEGFTIGILTEKNEERDLIGVGIVLLFHKSLEALNLGYVLRQASLRPYSQIRMVLCFIASVPLGIVIGTFVQMDDILRAMFIGISMGSILFQSISESVVQEFTFTKQRYSKYFTFLLGGLFTILVVLVIQLKAQESGHDHQDHDH